MREHDQLILRLVERVEAENGCALDRVTHEQLARAEASMGLPLPPLLARVYLEVADGGFGPPYRLYPLVDGRSTYPWDGNENSTVVTRYNAMRAADEWPEGVLPIMHWGCAMMAAVDCRVPGNPVLLYEPNAIEDDDSSTAWFQDADTLESWLEIWLAGTGWYEEDNDHDADFDLKPWPHARSRITT